MLALILFIYFVSFTDKPMPDTPALSPRAVAQRAKWQIATDALDYPVDAGYLDSLRHMGVKVHHTSRWFNGATCEMSESKAAQVAQSGFVKDVEMTRDGSDPIYSRRKRLRQQSEVGVQPVVNWTDAQLDLYNLKPLHQAGFEGQGILMTVCDGGFCNADTMSCFRQDSLEEGHFDFTDDTDDFYGWQGAHGTECLSVISGITPGFRGAATQARYYLMRSEEYVTESPKEMDNLVAALETADSLGVNVFSVSLGYLYFDQGEWSLSPYDMDGRQTRVSLAATIAARKGMLVCVAAGNEGYNPVNNLNSPADADSILTVGAVGTDSIIANFSSSGPSADGRVKPDVCAVGYQTTLIYPDGKIVRNNGTSFATPLIAGMAATLWSALPNENAMQIRERIIRSANRYQTPDTYRNQYGYGIPDAWLAYTMDIPMGATHIPSAVRTQKVLRNGQIMLLYDGRMYDIFGRKTE